MTYANKVFNSPRTNATAIGVAIQDGTKYNNAGCACLKRCITRIVAKRPTKYAINVEWK